MADVFISYSRRDIDFVHKLVDALKAVHRTVWVDLNDIPPTAEWLGEVYAGIESADNFICVLSPDFVASPICAKEVLHAKECKKRLVPIVRKDIASAGVDPALTSLNWIYFRDSDDSNAAFKQLIDAIDMDLEYIRTSKRLLVRAIEWENNKYNPSFALRGSGLSKAEHWLVEATGKKPSPTVLQTRYITASRHGATRRQWIVFSGTSLALLVTIVLLILTSILYNGQIVQTKRADANFATAVANLRTSRSETLAAQANSYLANHADALALLLSVQASRIENTFESRDSLLAALEYSPHIVKFLKDNGFTDRRYPVDDLAFSHHGKMLLSADDVSFNGDSDGVTLWNMTTGQPHILMLTAAVYPHGVTSITLSPDDRTFIAAGPDDVSLWSTKTGSRLIDLGAPYSTVVTFSPDGKILASGSCIRENASICTQKSILLWDLSSVEPISQPLSPAGYQHIPQPLPLIGYSGEAHGLAFSPDGQTLVSGDTSGILQLWNVQTRKPLGQPFMGHMGTIWHVAFSPDGTLLASCGEDGTVRVWQVATGQSTIFRGHVGSVRSLAFSPDGKLLVSGGSDETIRVWGVATGRSIKLNGHLGEVRSVAFTPDGRYIVSGDLLHGIILWDPYGLSAVPVSRRLYDGSEVNAAVFSPDGTLLASGDSHGMLNLWNVSKGTLVGTLIVQGDSAKSHIESLAFSPDGRIVASGSTDGTVILWNVVQRMQIAQVRYSGTLTGVAFSPKSCILAAGGSDGVTLWSVCNTTTTSNTVTLRLMYQLKNRLSDNHHINGIAFSPDGQMLASGGENKMVTIWNVKTGQMVGQPFVRSDQSFTGANINEVIEGVTFSPDGHKLVYIGDHGTIFIWDVMRHQFISSTSSDDNMGHRHSIAFSPDGKLMADVTQVTNVALLDLTRNILPVIANPIQHSGDVHSLMFSPDSQLLVSADGDGFITLTDTTVKGWEVRACSIANRNFVENEWALFNRFISSDGKYSKVCPEYPVHTSVTDATFSDAKSEASLGHVQSAFALYKQATQWIIATDDAEFNNEICRRGDIDGFAKEVLLACERAVQLEPDNGICHDSRGIARALMGDKQGAIEDFKFFLQWYSQYNPGSTTNYIAKRNGWIQELEAGRNPFDAKTLEEIRHNDIENLD